MLHGTTSEAMSSHFGLTLRHTILQIGTEVSLTAELRMRQLLSKYLAVHLVTVLYQLTLLALEWATELIQTVGLHLHLFNPAESMVFGSK